MVSTRSQNTNNPNQHPDTIGNNPIGAFQLKVAFCGTLATQFLICAIGSRQENSFKLLRVEMENYSHPHDNGNVLKRTSMDIDLFNIRL